MRESWRVCRQLKVYETSHNPNRAPTMYNKNTANDAGSRDERFMVVSKLLMVSMKCLESPSLLVVRGHYCQGYGTQGPRTTAPKSHRGVAAIATTAPIWIDKAPGTQVPIRPNNCSGRRHNTLVHPTIAGSEQLPFLSLEEIPARQRALSAWLHYASCGVTH